MVAGALLCAAAAAEARQFGPMASAPAEQKWLVRETFPGAVGEMTDAGADIALWEDASTSPSTWYVFVTGHVMQATGTTRFLTVRYNALNPDDPSDPPRRAYWPPLTDPASGEHRGAAITVHPATGEVYVTGPVPPFSGDPAKPDYFVIKYDKELAGIGGPGFPLWTRRYNGPADGGDMPVDIKVTGTGGDGAVVVTGTSWGGALTKNDIVTIVLCPNNGSFTNGWNHPSVEALGVARFDRAYGDDSAAELSEVVFACLDPEGCPCSTISAGIHVAVLGTSWGGAATGNDITMLKYSGNGSLDPLFDGWTDFYGKPGDATDEVGTGLVGAANGLLYACGYGPSAAGDLDYITLVYQAFPFTLPHRTDVDVRDFNGGNDLATDIQAGSVGAACPQGRVWVTGRAANGGAFDFGTRRYLVNLACVEPLLELTHDWDSSYGPVAGRDDQAAALALHDSLAVGDLDGYATGLSAGVSVTNYDTLTIGQRSAGGAPFWNLLYPGFGGHDAGKAIAAAVISGQVNVFIVGTSYKTGQGQDFIIIRYKQNIP